MANYYYHIMNRVYRAGEGLVCVWPSVALAVKDCNQANLKLWLEEHPFEVAPNTACSGQACTHPNTEAVNGTIVCKDCGNWL